MFKNRWFGGLLGWMIGGPMGALLGFVLGYLTEGDEEPTLSGSGQEGGNEEPYTQRAERDNFIFSLLVLMAYMIKADGRIMHSEMEYVRKFFQDNFGENAKNEAERILLRLFRQDIDVDACGRQIADNMDYGQRLQLLALLAAIARADGRTDDAEVQALRRIAQALQLPQSEVDSMLNLGGGTLESAYKVLEIQPSATDEEVRRAYKQLVLKNHPDRVASLGEDIRQQAEEKIKQINEAYNRVKDARGMK